ncbi:MAG: hypothetical protein LBJ92_01365 [Holosporales bacterium]|jgi:hypothetical protein|nr:hypothetical protein [Holosporales bacterium]
MNKSLWVSLFVLLVFGVAVSRVKYEVVFLRKKSQALQNDIEKCLDDLVVYEAEWSYLNDPKRLKTLCQKHLKGMRPMENGQIISHEDLVNSQFEEMEDDDPLNKRKAFKSFIDDSLGG